jgi:hypothetical protein
VSELRRDPDSILLLRAAPRLQAQCALAVVRAFHDFCNFKGIVSRDVVATETVDL